MQQQQPLKPSFLPPPPYPCDNSQQFLQQMSLSPYQELFYNSIFLLQQQQQQPSQMNLQQEQTLPPQSIISMCLQDPQMMQPQQLIQNSQISQPIQQQQIPFLYPAPTNMQDHHQEQSLESLTAQVAAMLYSGFGKIEAPQQLPFSLPEASQTQGLLQSPFLENNNIGKNINNTSNKNSTFEQDNLLNGLDPSQLIPLQNSSLLDYLAQLAQNSSNDQNVSLATALAAASIIQNSPNNTHIISPFMEVPPMTTTTTTAATTPELIFTTKNSKSAQKQTSDTQLNSKPFHTPHPLNSLEKHAFSPVEAQLTARTCSPRSCASRINNSQIQNHQPFDLAGQPPREQKTLPIVFLQHPQQDSPSQLQQKGGKSDNNNNNEIEEKLENSKNQLQQNNNIICGIASKPIKKRKKPLSQLKAHQFPSQSSDLSTNSQSLQINCKKNEQNTNSLLLCKDSINSNANTITFNTYSALSKEYPSGNRGTTTNATAVDEENIIVPLSKDTKLFNDLLDPLILFLKENSQGESIKKEEQQKMTAKNVNQPLAQKKQVKQNQSRRRSRTAKKQEIKEATQQQNPELSPILEDTCLLQTSKQAENMQVENTLENLGEQETAPKQQLLESQFEEQKQQQHHHSQEILGQRQEHKDQNQEIMPQILEEHEVEEEKQELLLDNQLLSSLQVPGSPESVPLPMNKMLRISPRRRVCSNETRDESDQSNNASLNSLPKRNSDKDTHNEPQSVEQSHVPTPVKKLQRLKRISQIAEERRKPSKINLKNTTTTTNTTVGLPHRSQTAFEERSNDSMIISPSKPSLLKTRNQSKIIHEITNPSQNSAENNNTTNITFSNMDLFSEATQVLMNQFEKHYLKCMIHSNSQIRINEFKTFMKNARKNDELIGLLLNPRACPFSSSFVDFLRLPAIKWIRKTIEPKKQLIYFQLIQIFKSEDRGVSGLRPRRDRNLMSNFALSK